MGDWASAGSRDLDSRYMKKERLRIPPSKKEFREKIGTSFLQEISSRRFKETTEFCVENGRCQREKEDFSVMEHCSALVGGLGGKKMGSSLGSYKQFFVKRQGEKF